MKNTLLFILALVLLPAVAAAWCRSSQDKLSWVGGYFNELQNSTLAAATATGYDLNTARASAVRVVLERQSMATGSNVNISFQGNNVVVQGGDDLTVKARVIDEYHENCGSDGYRVSVLMQTAHNPSYQFERVNLTTDYPFSGRVFIPGAAQIHKGSKFKGAMFITWEILLLMAAGGMTLGLMLEYTGVYDASTYKEHYSYENPTQERIDSWRKDMESGEKMLTYARNGVLAAAGVLYVWNILDGIFAEGGRKHVVIGSSQLRFAPYATTTGAGVVLTLGW